MRIRALIVLLAALPLCATITSINNNKGDISGSGAQSFTISSTTAGNLLDVKILFRTVYSDTITTITYSGGTCVSAGARSVQGTARGGETWYCANMPAGVTSLSITQSGSGTVSVTTRELHTDSGTLSLMVAGATSNGVSAASHALGTSLVLTGNAVVVDYFASSIFSPVSIAAPFTAYTDFHANYTAYALNQTGTIQADLTINNSGSVAYLTTGAAYGEVAATSKIRHRVTQ